MPDMNVANSARATEVDKDARNLILTGLMGTGKSTLGQLVATDLEREFIDTDDYIETRFGPAASILDGPGGDDRFRAVEEQVANELAYRDKLVIATGGRFLVNQKNIDTLRPSGEILCLVADLKDIVKRLMSSTADTYRPRFANATDKLALLQVLRRQSEPLLNQFDQLCTSGHLPADSAEQIKQWFSKRT